MARISRWQTPWPPLKVGENEWVIIRDSIRHPAAVVRRIEFAPGVTRFRVVTWAERSDDRQLLGYVLTLELADMLVRFSQEPPRGHRSPWAGAGLTGEDWSAAAREATGTDRRTHTHDGPPQASWG